MSTMLYIHYCICCCSSTTVYPLLCICRRVSAAVYIVLCILNYFCISAVVNMYPDLVLYIYLSNKIFCLGLVPQEKPAGRPEKPLCTHCCLSDAAIRCYPLLFIRHWYPLLCICRCVSTAVDLLLFICHCVSATVSTVLYICHCICYCISATCLLCCISTTVSAAVYPPLYIYLCISTILYLPLCLLCLLCCISAIGFATVYLRLCICPCVSAPVNVYLDPILYICHCIRHCASATVYISATVYPPLYICHYVCCIVESDRVQRERLNYLSYKSYYLLNHLMVESMLLYT